MVTYAPPGWTMANAVTGGGYLPLQQALVGGDPAVIQWYVAEVLRHAAKLAQLVTELEGKKKELESVWPEGSASDRAATQVGEGIGSFLKTIVPMDSGARTVGKTGAVVQGGQQGMSSVAAIAEPVINGLLSSPLSKPAGVATAVAVLGKLTTFLTTIGSMFTALGAKELGTIFTQLGTVTGGVEKLLTSVTGTDPAAATPATATPAAATPAAAPAPAAATPAALTAEPVASPTAAALSPASAPGGSPYAATAWATGPDGAPYGFAIDPATGNLMASGYDPATGLPGGAAALGDWQPVDIGSGTGGAGAGAGGSGTDPGSGSTTGTGGGADGGASTSGDDTTVVTVSSGGESVTFDIAATDPTTSTTIDAEVGSEGAETQVQITVGPSTA